MNSAQQEKRHSRPHGGDETRERLRTAEAHDRLWQRCSFDLDGLRQALGTRWDAIKTYNLELANTPAVAEAGGKLMELFAMPAIPAEVLGRIAAPTTLIWGRPDLATPVRIAEAASVRHRWALHVIEDAAADRTIDQPAAFLDALRSALGEEGR
jgi:pimeloyl-ACP methyl ester carboxylesterase